jgi:hypothetical protein
MEHENSKSETIILTIETPKGKWENAAFAKTTKVQEVIQQVITKFGFAPDGNYKLKVKGQNDFLEPERPLVSYHLPDHTVLVFTDLGKGA